MISHPDPNSSKASIREVYAIVKDLEEKVVEELHRTEGRLMEAIERIDGRHQADIAGLRVDVDDLKAWRDQVDDRRAESVARKEGKLWAGRAVMNFVEDYWKVILVIFAALMFLLNNVDINIH